MPGSVGYTGDIELNQTDRVRALGVQGLASTVHMAKEWWDPVSWNNLGELYSAFPKLSFLPNCWHIFFFNLPPSFFHLFLLLWSSTSRIVAHPLLYPLVLDSLWQGSLTVRFLLGSWSFLFLSQPTKWGKLNCMAHCFPTHISVFLHIWSQPGTLEPLVLGRPPIPEVVRKEKSAMSMGLSLGTLTSRSLLPENVFPTLWKQTK